MKSPTYTATEILKMADTVLGEEIKILADLIDEEIELYSLGELTILMRAAIIIFIRQSLVHYKGFS